VETCTEKCGGRGKGEGSQGAGGKGGGNLLTSEREVVGFGSVTQADPVLVRRRDSGGGQEAARQLSGGDPKILAVRSTKEHQRLRAPNAVI
jgi:hypothetical protein